MKKLVIVIGIITLLLFSVVAYYFGPGGSGILGQLVLNDGSEFEVIQTYNHWFAEPYTIDFYFKTPGSKWGWCYIDHEDTRWTRARLRKNSDKNSIEIYRGNTLRAEYFIGEKSFALYSGYHRKLPAPQELRDPPM